MEQTKKPSRERRIVLRPVAEGQLEQVVGGKAYSCGTRYDTCAALVVIVTREAEPQPQVVYI